MFAYFIFGEEGKKKVDNQANKAHKMLFEDHQEQVSRRLSNFADWFLTNIHSWRRQQRFYQRNWRHLLKIWTTVRSCSSFTKGLYLTLDMACAAVHLDIMHITVLAERRCKGLYDIILSDILSKGGYGFDVSPYSFSLERSSLYGTSMSSQINSIEVE